MASSVTTLEPVLKDCEDENKTSRDESSHGSGKNGSESASAPPSTSEEAPTATLSKAAAKKRKKKSRKAKKKADEEAADSTIGITTAKSMFSYVHSVVEDMKTKYPLLSEEQLEEIFRAASESTSSSASVSELLSDHLQSSQLHDSHGTTIYPATLTKIIINSHIMASTAQRKAEEKANEEATDMTLKVAAATSLGDAIVEGFETKYPMLPKERLESIVTAATESVAPLVSASELLSDHFPPATLTKIVGACHAMASAAQRSQELQTDKLSLIERGDLTMDYVRRAEAPKLLAVFSMLPQSNKDDAKPGIDEWLRKKEEEDYVPARDVEPLFAILKTLETNGVRDVRAIRMKLALFPGFSEGSRIRMRGEFCDS